MHIKHAIPLICSVAVLIAISAAGYWMYHSISTLRQDITTLFDESYALKSQADRVSSLRQTAEATSDELAHVHDFFVPANGALAFVEYIENIAKLSKLQYKIEFFDVEKSDTYSEHKKELLRTSIRVIGPRTNTTYFLSLIESLPYNSTIKRVDMRRSVIGASATDAPAKQVDEWSTLVDFTVVKQKE
jgi:hypothetical protein